MKKQARSIAIFLVGWLALVVPIQRVQAVFPVPIVAGAALVFESGALATGYAASIALIGAAVYAISFPKSGGGEALRVLVNPKASPHTPSGWASPPTAGAAPVPPGTAASTPVYSSTMAGGTVVSGGTHAELGAAVVAYFAAHPVVGFYPCEYQGVSGSQLTYKGVASGYPCSASTGVVYAFSSGITCPTGYTASAGVCTLTSAPSVPYPSDSIGQARLDSGVVTMDSRDPDNSGAPSEVAIGSGTITVTSSGSKITLKSEVDGTATVTTITGRGDGTSDREVIVLAPADSGASNGGRVVTGGVKDRVIGEGGSANTGAAPGADTAGTQPVPCGLPGSPPCKIDETGTPTGTAAHAASASSVAAALSSLESKIGEQTSKTLPWSWSFTFPTFACNPWNFTYTPTFSGLSGTTFSKAVDWCPTLGTARDLWGYAISVITLIYLWRSFTSVLRSA